MIGTANTLLLFPCASASLREVLAGGPARGPGGLEVEAAGDAVDVERFAGEEEAGNEAALHGFEIHLGERDAAAGDEFLLVHAFAGDGEFSGGEERSEFPGLRSGQIWFNSADSCRIEARVSWSSAALR